MKVGGWLCLDVRMFCARKGELDGCYSVVCVRGYCAEMIGLAWRIGVVAGQCSRYPQVIDDRMGGPFLLLFLTAWKSFKIKTALVVLAFFGGLSFHPSSELLATTLHLSYPGSRKQRRYTFLRTLDTRLNLSCSFILPTLPWSIFYRMLNKLPSARRLAV